MADNYLEFSEMIPRLSNREVDWLRRQLQIVHVFGDKEYAEDELPDHLKGENAEWVGCRAYRDMEDYDPADGDEAGFEYEFREDHEPKGWGRHLWLYAVEYAALDRLAHLIRKFLKEFRPNDIWSLTYATGCSKPRVGEFGGGALVVTAADVKWTGAYDFVEEQAKVFREQSVVPRLVQLIEESGLADDASQLNNAMILTLDLETVEPPGRDLADTAEGQPPYLLNIDGPKFRAQRALLVKLLARTQRLVPPTSSPDEKELLEGLINLTDAIADQAHDRYGVDCLLDETDQPCECELPGHFCCGVPGILAHLENGQSAPGAKVERCDLCQRYPSDEAALEKLRELGLGPS